MDIDSFWTLIEACRQQALSQDDRLEWLRGELSQRSPAEIVEFQVCLDQVTADAFTWDLWAAAERIFGGWCSDDGFWGPDTPPASVGTSAMKRKQAANCRG
ncbi:DUF4240 domain-containing protein [Actinacidiphila glaucinigra]|uniref:DUF4240 domain-containing protein n=1 Tax=Actinacidiphila glaucinigra TaxID=235986 RepID=UPI0037BB8873